MNIKSITYAIAGGTFLLVLSFFLGRLTAPEMGNSAAIHDHSSEGEAASQEPQIWTCSMHPQIQQPEPGDCPICGMDLIPLVKGGGADDGPREMSMSESSRALADIQTTSIEKRFPEAEIRLVGKLEYDETRISSLTARFPARIDELYVNFTGVPVKEGEHLARVYSPELLTAESELLTAHQFDPNGSAVESAREKLRLWDLLPEQIEGILKSGEPEDHFDLKAPIGGVVASKHVNEGDYVKTGQSLFKIVDLSLLWLELDVYESDLAWLRVGQSVEFSVESYPGETFPGQIVFIEPEFDRKNRTVSVRVNVPNEDMKLKPGMFARAIVYSKVAAAGKVFSAEFAGKWISPMHPEIVKDEPGQCDVCGMDLVRAEELGYVQSPDEEPPLVIPTSAVLRTGKRAVVYVEKTDADQPTYEGLEIEIGSRAGDVFIVKSGLAEGERVVSKGAFKIDSALQIQAKPSMMNPDGGGPVPGHDHGGSSEAEDHSAHAVGAVPSFEVGTAKQLLPLYSELQLALAGDDLEKSKNALKEMMNVTGHSGAAADLIHLMLAGESLDDLRRPHFETLSNALIKVVSENPDSFEGDVYQMHCPMVYSDRGGDWLQLNDKLQNPYFGSMMLTCGEVRAKLTQGENR